MITRIPFHTLSALVPRTGYQSLRRISSSTTQIIPQAHYNVVFDIDGVLIKVNHLMTASIYNRNEMSGKKVLPQTHRALGLLQANNVPYIFLTNGGGLKESEKAEQLSKKIGVHISPKQLILSHSPMRELVSKYEDSNVMIVGGNGSDCRHVAEHYGFKHIVTPEEVHAVFPFVCPSSPLEARSVPLAEKYLQNVYRPVDAIMVFHDSVDWGRDLQIMLDALISREGYLGTIKTQKELHTTPQSVPIYFSNSDFVWSNEYPTPRLAQGAFRACLERLYEETTGHKLKYTTYGKPMTATYQYAEAVLNRIAPDHLDPDGIPKRRTVYAIGDNPYADIAGANGYGWTSLLVKTGVFKPEGDENHHTHPATAVVEDVEDAVRWIISRELRKDHPF
ncbi:hypothetical protein FBU30_010139 [Linnemannia zychae]|nr:hypothetical protein FBU30_010139 [Linnemannia zychae]